MNAIAGPMPQDSKLARDAQALRAGLVVFAAYHLLLGAYMAFAPHSFFTNIGPFGARNDHYVRDLASFTAALGVGFVLALSRPSWRVPVLAVTTVQFALHSLNHLLDIGKAHPVWTGYFDFFTLLLSTGLLAWLWRAAVAQERMDSRGSFPEAPLPLPHPPRQRRAT